jgi:hypothetical protein
LGLSEGIYLPPLFLSAFSTLCSLFCPQRIAIERNYLLLRPFNDVDVIEGQATLGMEILEDLPDVDTVSLVVVFSFKSLVLRETPLSSTVVDN